MQKQTVEFAVQEKNGIIQNVGKSVVLVPKTNFKGGTINWYVDKVKKAVDKDEKV